MSADLGRGIAGGCPLHHAQYLGVGENRACCFQGQTTYASVGVIQQSGDDRPDGMAGEAGECGSNCDANQYLWALCRHKRNVNGAVVRDLAGKTCSLHRQF